MLSSQRDESAEHKKLIDELVRDRHVQLSALHREGDSVDHPQPAQPVCF